MALMAKSSASRPHDPRTYRVGIDVGTNSVGLAAIEFDEAGSPVSVLSAISWIHDSGVLDPKTATTPLAAAGMARRARRLRRRRVKRLVALDNQLKEWGWSALADDGDPYQPWRARMRLATQCIRDETDRHAHLATALRHMARHRGWRNPYAPVSSLYEPALPSEFLVGVPETDSRPGTPGVKQRVEERSGVVFSDDVTVAELAVEAIDHDNRVPLRMGKTEIRREPREFSYLSGKLLQSDNANELRAYARVQGLSAETLRQMIDLVFMSKSPRGSWVGKIGKDPLDDGLRAPKASDAFQRYRIVSTLANVRVRDGGTERRLTRDEIVKAYEFLVNLKPGEQPTWGDLGAVIGQARRTLSGTASSNVEGDERLPQRPPVHATDQAIRASRKLSKVRDHWVESDGEERDALISLIVDGVNDEASPAEVAAGEVMNSLAERDLGELAKLDLPAGRAAYSLASLRRLSAHILATGDDLHEARKAEFGIADDWVPPSEPIGAPVGHPAVDRVSKIIARFLLAAEAEWGVPQRVMIEHVREAFSSEAKVRRVDRENQRRFKAKLEQRESVSTKIKSSGRVRDSDVRRYEAVQRQNCTCLYCGATITYDTAEMDHIVPRKGIGSTNTRTNLVAVCIECNRSKSNTAFATWASRNPKSGVSMDEAVNRTKFWQKDNGMPQRQWVSFLKEVRDRLERTDEDPEIDSRSMESVAWMANELRDRIAAHLRGDNANSGPQRVFVHRGALTADARRIAGVEDRIPWIGGAGKTRLDRRHHAVDAAIQTLLDESVARTLAERISLRQSEQFLRSGVETWKTFTGSSPAAQARFATWTANMRQLTDQLVAHFEQDHIVVAENLRLRPGNGQVHDDTINPLTRRFVGDALTRDEIDAASTPQLWTALTRDPDFSETLGLPANPARRLRVLGARQHWYQASDEIEFFDKPRAALAVQGGWAELGDSTHHIRIYRWEERSKVKYGMLRVFAIDLLSHRKDDLFTVEPDPSWISMRAAHPSIGRVDLKDREYLGWLVKGDEVLVTMSALESDRMKDLMQILGLSDVMHWQFAGTDSPTKMVLRPRHLAAEGLDRLFESHVLSTTQRESLTELIDRRGWRISVNELFGKGHPAIVRRDALGRPRLTSRAGLPTSWRAK